MTQLGNILTLDPMYFLVLGKFPVLGILLIWIIVGQGPDVLAVVAGESCLDFFSHLSFLLSPPLWEAA